MKRAKLGQKQSQVTIRPFERSMEELSRTSEFRKVQFLRKCALEIIDDNRDRKREEKKKEDKKCALEMIDDNRDLNRDKEKEEEEEEVKVEVEVEARDRGLKWLSAELAWRANEIARASELGAKKKILRKRWFCPKCSFPIKARIRDTDDDADGPRKRRREVDDGDDDDDVGGVGIERGRGVPDDDEGKTAKKTETKTKTTASEMIAVKKCELCAFSFVKKARKRRRRRRMMMNANTV